VSALAQQDRLAADLIGHAAEDILHPLVALVDSVCHRLPVGSVEDIAGGHRRWNPILARTEGQCPINAISPGVRLELEPDRQFAAFLVNQVARPTAAVFTE